MTAERLKQKRGIEKPDGDSHLALCSIEWPSNWKGVIKRSNIGQSSYRETASGGVDNGQIKRIDLL